MNNCVKDSDCSEKYSELSFDIFSLFESTDVAKYCKEKNNNLNVIKAAYLINRNQKISIERKHEV